MSEESVRSDLFAYCELETRTRYFQENFATFMCVCMQTSHMQESFNECK